LRTRDLIRLPSPLYTACRCELMTTKSTPDFPDWIPSAARDKILELRQREDSTPEELAVLDRLATYEVMHTEVWQRLPPSAVGMEGRIIEWTVVGLGLAATTRPPFPKNKVEIAEPLAKYPRAQDAATLAGNLLKAIDENRQSTEGLWEAYTRTKLSYLEARNIVEWLAYFFDLLSVKNQLVAAALKLPRIRKKKAENVKELYLSRFLSQRFIDDFHDYYDRIVSALVGVTLDSEDGPDAVTIRGRRRRQRKISSKK